MISRATSYKKYGDNFLCSCWLFQAWSTPTPNLLKLWEFHEGHLVTGVFVLVCSKQSVWSSIVHVGHPCLMDSSLYVITAMNLGAILSTLAISLCTIWLPEWRTMGKQKEVRVRGHYWMKHGLHVHVIHYQGSPYIQASLFSQYAGLYAHIPTDLHKITNK